MVAIAVVITEANSGRSTSCGATCRAAPASVSVTVWSNCTRWRCRSGSVRAATNSSSWARETGPLKISQSRSSSTAYCPAGSSATSSGLATSSATSASVRWLSAWTTRSALVAKWWAWAPRVTPARSQTRVVVSPA